MFVIIKIIIIKTKELIEIIGQIDSDFIGCQNSIKSMLDHIYLLVESAFWWKRAKQFLIVSYAMAAQFITCYEVSNHGMWLQNFVKRLCIVDNIDRSLNLFCDNKSTMLYSNNNKSLMKSKYIDFKFLVIKERVQSGQLYIEQISINSMIADLLTNGLLPKLFHEHTARMGVVSSKVIQFYQEFMILNALTKQTLFNYFSYGYLRLFSAEIKFLLIHTLVLVQFDFDKV